MTRDSPTGVLTVGEDLDGLFLPDEEPSDDARAGLLSDYKVFNKKITFVSPSLHTNTACVKLALINQAYCCCRSWIYTSSKHFAH